MLGANASGISSKLEGEIDKLPRVEGTGAGHDSTNPIDQFEDILRSQPHEMEEIGKIPGRK